MLQLPNKLPMTPHLQGVLEKARERSINLRKANVDIETLFSSFIVSSDISIQTIFSKCGLNLNKLAELSLDNLKFGKSNNPAGNLSNKVITFLELTDTVSFQDLKMDYISSCSWLLSFFNQDIMPQYFMDYLGIEHRDKILNSEISNIIFHETLVFVKDLSNDSPLLVQKQNNDLNFGERLDMLEDNPILSEFADNLNLLASEGKFDKIVDFDKKIDEIATILCRKKKPNAILVGPAGTGKTSLVEGLAAKIVNGEAPELLSDKVIYSLNLSSMVAGTQFRGQFEQRLENFIKEVKKYNNIILFIDEIHTLVGAGGTNNNSLEASNILKPELARGTISCIGATTINEYSNTIKMDSALDRRFERVMIKEPSKFQMQSILPEIISYYEDFHKLKYSKDFVGNVIEYCEIFLPNKFYPDKAIDVIDQCGAQAKVHFWEINDSFKEKQKKLVDSIDENGNFDKKLQQEVEEEMRMWKENIINTSPTVDVVHLQTFFQKRINILSQNNNVNTIFDNLKKQIIGQREALEKISQSMKICNFGLRNTNKKGKPDSYLIFGKKSSGKTLFCESLKEEIEKTGGMVIHYNGIEFADHHSFYKILSDSRSNTSLCEKICMYPNSVLIIDDFHKVNQSCFGLLAQILKEGKIQMQSGETADFSNCKIFLSCDESSSLSSMGFATESSHGDAVIDPQLSKLVSEKTRFNELKNIHLRRILFNKLNKIKNSLALQGVKLEFTFEFLNNFVEKHFKSQESIGNFNQVLEKHMISQISKKILNGEIEICL
jgi:ATP-dependent Clp protease ATP-binding subunit ClpC